MLLAQTQPSKVCLRALLTLIALTLGIAMYQYYQIMICLLKFDFFCFVGVTMQVNELICVGELLLTMKCTAFDSRPSNRFRRVWSDRCGYPDCVVPADRRSHCRQERDKMVRVAVDHTLR